MNRIMKVDKLAVNDSRGLWLVAWGVSGKTWCKMRQIVVSLPLDAGDGFAAEAYNSNTHGKCVHVLFFLLTDKEMLEDGRLLQERAALLECLACFAAW